MGYCDCQSRGENTLGMIRDPAVKMEGRVCRSGEVALTDRWDRLGNQWYGGTWSDGGDTGERVS